MMEGESSVPLKCSVTEIFVGFTPNKLALCTTVYPGVEPFLGEWYASVLQQTDSGYTLYIALDGLRPNQAVKAMGGLPDGVIWVHAAAGGTPASVRQRVLAPIVDQCDGVVLVDSDDILHPERVAAARQMLRHCELAGCALRLVDQAGKDLGLVFNPAANGAPEAVLPRHNLFGLSNTSWRSSLLRRCLPIPPVVELVDWFLATRAWLLGAALCFDPKVRMDYRQHASNMARVRPPFTREQVVGDTGRVRRHFEIVMEATRDGTIPSRRQHLAEVAQDVARFAECVLPHPEVLSEYLHALNALNPAPIWWSCVAHPALSHIWSD